MLFNTLICILFVHSLVEAVDRQPDKITIKRQIESSGFHRYLTTEILMYYFKTNTSKSWPPPNDLLLVESFDSDAYVDSYELKFKNYERMYSFVFSNKVNTESARYDALKFNIFLYLQPNLTHCYAPSKENLFNSSVSEYDETEYLCRIFVRLPIHVRYREPATEEYVNFTLKNPQLFQKAVLQRQLELNNLNWSMLINSSDFTDVLAFPCVKETRKPKSDRLINERANDYLTKTYLKKTSLIDMSKFCTWNKLSFVSLTEQTHLKITIPVGNTQHELLVLIVTLMIVTYLLLMFTKCVLKCAVLNQLSFKKGRNFA